MESINLDMEDLFDTGNDNNEGEDLGNMQADLPDLDDAEQPMAAEGDQEDEGNEEGEDGVVANLQRLSKGAAKKKVMKPQPKLDSERLKSDRGLAILPTLFDNVSFKGKGHEASDLKVLMTKLEHWGHRLFPKMQFEEFTDRLEKLGAKKPVQTTLKRIRLDMPILDSDYVQQYDEEEGANNEGADTANASDDEGNMMNAEEAYEAMIRQEREHMEQNRSSDQEEEDMQSQRSQPGPSRTEETAALQSSQAKPTTPPTSQPSVPPVTPGSVSDEQKARMERNRMIALEKRAKRMGVPVSTLLPPKEKASSQSPSVQKETPDKEGTSEPLPEVSQNNTGPGKPQDIQPPDTCSKSDNKSSTEHAENNQEAVMQTEEELLADLEGSDEESSESKTKKPTEFSLPPENTEAMMNDDSANENSKTKHVSADSEIETEELHLALDTTESDEEVTMASANNDCDKENISNVNNNTDDSSAFDSEVIKVVDKKGMVADS